MTRKIIYIVLGLVVVLSAAFFYWSLQPSYTVAKAAYSIVAKNRRSFDRAVELNRVADGLADDSVAQALKNMGADPMGDAGLVQSALALKMVEALKPQLVSFVH